MTIWRWYNFFLIIILPTHALLFMLNLQLTLEPERFSGKFAWREVAEQWEWFSWTMELYLWVWERAIRLEQEDSRASMTTVRWRTGATLRPGWSYAFNMADKGPFLTSCIIFYLSIGAAIFQILEEPNWQSARDRYTLQKENIVKKYKCLTKLDLEEILEVRVCLFLKSSHEDHVYI